MSFTRLNKFLVLVLLLVIIVSFWQYHDFSGKFQTAIKDLVFSKYCCDQERLMESMNFVSSVMFYNDITPYNNGTHSVVYL